MSRYNYAGKFRREDEDAEAEPFDGPPIVVNPEAIGDPDANPIVIVGEAGPEVEQ